MELIKTKHTLGNDMTLILSKNGDNYYCPKADLVQYKQNALAGTKVLKTDSAYIQTWNSIVTSNRNLACVWGASYYLHKTPDIQASDIVGYLNLLVTQDDTQEVEEVKIEPSEVLPEPVVVDTLDEPTPNNHTFNPYSYESDVDNSIFGEDLGDEELDSQLEETHASKQPNTVPPTPLQPEELEDVQDFEEAEGEFEVAEKLNYSSTEPIYQPPETQQPFVPYQPIYGRLDDDLEDGFEEELHPNTLNSESVYSTPQSTYATASKSQLTEDEKLVISKQTSLPKTINDILTILCDKDYNFDLTESTGEYTLHINKKK